MSRKLTITFFATFIGALALLAIFSPAIHSLVGQYFGWMVPVTILLSMPLFAALLALLVAKLVAWKDRFFFRDKLSVWTDVAIVGGISQLGVAMAFAYVDLDFYNLIHSPKVLLVMLSPMLGVGIAMAAFKDAVRHMTKKKEGKGVFLQSFLMAALLVTVFFACMGVLIFERGVSPEHIVRNVSATHVFVLAVTLLVASALALAIKLWKKYIALAIAILVLFVIVFIVAVVIYFRKASDDYRHIELSSNGYDYSDHDYYEGHDYVMAGDYDYDYEEGESEYGEEDYYEEGDPESFYLDFLWKRESMDHDSVTAAVKYGLNEFDVLDFPFDAGGQAKLMPYLWSVKEKKGFDVGQGFGGKAYQKIIEYIWKHKEDLQISAIFAAYSDVIQELLPWDDYCDKGYDRLVDQLMLAYDDLDNIDGSFSRVYEIMTDGDGQSHSDLYEAIDDNGFISEASKVLLRSGGSVDQSRAVWVYSFWARRYEEGKIHDVHNTLRMLIGLYGA